MLELSIADQVGGDAAFLSRAEVVLCKAWDGVVKGCGWHGMQAVSHD
jgi:hypothetical protein